MGRTDRNCSDSSLSDGGAVTGEGDQRPEVVVATTLSVQGEVCARGEVVAVQVPEHLIPDQVDQ